MAGAQFTEDEIRAEINEGLPDDQQLNDGQALINKIYGGGAPEGVAAANRVNAAQLVTLINRVINDDDLVEAFARIMGSRTNEAIISLINSHNPYTSNNMQDMTIFSGNPDLEKKSENKFSHIEMEVDGPYTMPKEWYFKGLPQQINKAVRIKYRCRARNIQVPELPQLNPHHWITAYLLIGYEDGGA
jgi:hypothetical protein